VSQDVVSGTYEVPSVYEIIQIGSTRRSGFVGNNVRHKFALSRANFKLVTYNK
jgi:hypothetical protein